MVYCLIRAIGVIRGSSITKRDSCTPRGSRVGTMGIRFQGYDPQGGAFQPFVATSIGERQGSMRLFGRCATSGDSLLLSGMPKIAKR
jgi:hypothetical protein